MAFKREWGTKRPLPEPRRCAGCGTDKRVMFGSGAEWRCDKCYELSPDGVAASLGFAASINGEDDA